MFITLFQHKINFIMKYLTKPDKKKSFRMNVGELELLYALFSDFIVSLDINSTLVLS